MTTEGSASRTAVRPDVRAFLDILNPSPMGRIGELSVAETRAIFDQARAGRPAVDHGLAIVRDLSFPSAGVDVGIRFYDLRTERRPGPLVLYFHGGGFVLGDLDSHHALCLEMARALDLPLVSVDYRLAPEHPWPAAPQDAEAAARWCAAASGQILGRDVTGLVLAGDSAGANLAAVTAGALRDRPAATPVIVQALIYPTTGSGRRTASMAAFGEGYFLTQQAMDWFNGHYGAPVGEPSYDLFASELSGMPATLLVTAGLDPLRDEGRAYAAALVQAGVNVVYREAAGNIHGCFGMAAAIPSSAADVAGALVALRLLVDDNLPHSSIPDAET